MKSELTILATIVATTLCMKMSAKADDITPKSVPPVVVKTVPEAGSDDIPPGEFEIKATFSKKMADHSWSWCTVWDDSCPQGIGTPKFDTDRKTCSMKVKLEAGKTYGYWLNSGRFNSFTDTHGRSAVPYLLVFTTSGQGEADQNANSNNETEKYILDQVKQAQAGNYWSKLKLWQGYAQGEIPEFDSQSRRTVHEVKKDSADANKWLAELVKDAYLAKFEPVNDFNPSTPEEMLAEFSNHCHLFSGKSSLGGASFFRTTKVNGKLIGSFLTATPDEFKAAIARDPNFKLISIEKVTPEMFVAHEASEQESL